MKLLVGSVNKASRKSVRAHQILAACPLGQRCVLVRPDVETLVQVTLGMAHWPLGSLSEMARLDVRSILQSAL